LSLEGVTEFMVVADEIGAQFSGWRVESQ
jgi:hypothetical protein